MDITKKFHPFALKKLVADERDLKFGDLFTLPKITDLPDEFGIANPLQIKDQKQSDFCFAFASTSVSEDQEEVVLDPFYQVMLAKQIEGDPNGFGCDNRSTAQSFTEYGSIEASFSPYTIDTPREKIIDPASWTDKDYKTLALAHRKKGYAFITGQYDLFDNIRATMFHGNRQSVVLGVEWCVEWIGAQGGIIDHLGTSVSGHDIKIFGWKTINGNLYLVAQLSNGTDIGDEGIFYLSREVINAQKDYGGFTFIPFTKDEVLRHQQYNVKLDLNVIVRYTLIAIGYLKKLCNL